MTTDGTDVGATASGYDKVNAAYGNEYSVVVSPYWDMSDGYSVACNWSGVPYDSSDCVT